MAIIVLYCTGQRRRHQLLYRLCVCSSCSCSLLSLSSSHHFFFFFFFLLSSRSFHSRFAGVGRVMCHAHHPLFGCFTHSSLPHTHSMLQQLTWVYACGSSFYNSSVKVSVQDVVVVVVVVVV